jgi:adenosylmethionine-8-amino-7-oxononanoate aminotransferase
VVAPPNYIRRVWEVCTKHDIAYISDEVVTAFGRLGHFFASEVSLELAVQQLFGAV